MTSIEQEASEWLRNRFGASPHESVTSGMLTANDLAAFHRHMLSKAGSAPAASGQGVEVEKIRITLEKCRDAFDLKADDFEDKYYPQAGPTGIIADINVAIKRLSSLAADRWIAVSERLPDEGSRVIVFVDLGRENSFSTSMYFGKRTGADEDERRKDDDIVQWRQEHGRYPLGPQSRLITHWTQIDPPLAARGEEVDGRGR